MSLTRRPVRSFRFSRPTERSLRCEAKRDMHRVSADLPIYLSLAAQRPSGGQPSHVVREEALPHRAPGGSLRVLGRALREQQNEEAQALVQALRSGKRGGGLAAVCVVRAVRDVRPARVVEEGEQARGEGRDARRGRRCTWRCCCCGQLGDRRRVWRRQGRERQRGVCGEVEVEQRGDDVLVCAEGPAGGLGAEREAQRQPDELADDAGGVK